MLNFSLEFLKNYQLELASYENTVVHKTAVSPYA